MEFTKREYQQFYHGISMSLLSKKSAQKWKYDDETAEEIRFLEGLESKVLDKIRQADTPQTDLVEYTPPTDGVEWEDYVPFDVKEPLNHVGVIRGETDCA